MVLGNIIEALMHENRPLMRFAFTNTITSSVPISSFMRLGLRNYSPYCPNAYN